MKKQIWILALGVMLTACASASQATTIASDSRKPGSPQPALTLLPAEAPPTRRGKGIHHRLRQTLRAIFGNPFGRTVQRWHSLYRFAQGSSPTDEGDEWLNDREPVVFVEVNEETKAYPIQRQGFICRKIQTERK